MLIFTVLKLCFFFYLIGLDSYSFQCHVTDTWFSVQTIMNRQITWKPAKDAPILKKFSNLSDDAQCILSAFYKDKRQSSKFASQRGCYDYFYEKFAPITVLQ